MRWAFGGCRQGMDLPLYDVTFRVAAGYSRIRAVSFLSRVKQLSCAPKLCRKVQDKAAAGSVQPQPPAPSLVIPNRVGLVIPNVVGLVIPNRVGLVIPNRVGLVIPNQVGLVILNVVKNLDPSTMLRMTISTPPHLSFRT